MSETEEVKDSQKTVVSFIAGLIVGALLLWMFGGDKADDTANVKMDDDVDVEILDEDAMEVIDMTSDTTDGTTVASELNVGTAAVGLQSRMAGSLLVLESATFPTDAGWVAVRSYTNDELGTVLGASRYSKEQGLVPTEIELLSPTVAGKEYAIVFFSENGDRQFNMRTDLPLNVAPIGFTAE